MRADIDALLRRMVEIGASDLHVKPGNRPGFRVAPVPERDTHVAEQPRAFVAIFAPATPPSAPELKAFLQKFLPIGILRLHQMADHFD